MKPGIAMTFGLTLILSAAPAPGEESRNGAAVPPAPKIRKVCRLDDSIGSIRVRRTCRTKEEWAEIDAVNSNNAQRQQEMLRPKVHPDGR